MTAGPVDVQLPAGPLPAGKRYPNGIMTWPYPLVDQPSPLLPQLVPAAQPGLLSESQQGFLYLQRIYVDRMEFWWLFVLDEAARRARLCRLVMRADRLPSGALLTNADIIGLLEPRSCAPRAVPGVPLAFFSWNRPRPQDLEQPFRTFASARFTVAGVTWQASVVAAQRETPASFAFHTRPWSRQDWRMVARVPAPAANIVSGLKESYFELGLPHDARSGVILRFSEPDLVKAGEDRAYSLAVCRLEADRVDAPLPQDARLLAWCNAEVLKAGRQVPETPLRIFAPPGITAPPR